MPKADYIKKRDQQFLAQLNAFKNNIGSYATALGVSAAQLSAQAADATYFAYVLACREVLANSSQQHTNWKDLLRAGGTPPSAGAPVAPTLPASVPAVEPGIEPRFRALVRQIKVHTNYNIAIGAALGIEAAEQTGPDLMALQPRIRLTVAGAEVKVSWDWQGYSKFLDMIEIEVDRGDGQGYKTLAMDTTPGYRDTYPFPPNAMRWKYRAIFRVGDARVGQWSNEVSVNVGG